MGRLLAKRGVTASTVVLVVPVDRAIAAPGFVAKNCLARGDIPTSTHFFGRFIAEMQTLGGVFHRLLL